tara:strand:+ start:491 stop:664 length:174 start_codon:yes stop_codon:yes gene_type:complete
MSHRMSKESASALAGAYSQVAKYREAFDIAMKYCKLLSLAQQEELKLDLESKGIEYE